MGKAGWLLMGNDAGVILDGPRDVWGEARPNPETRGWDWLAEDRWIEAHGSDLSRDAAMRSVERTLGLDAREGDEGE